MNQKQTVPFFVCIRLVLGAVFVLSGFVKAADPLGTAYKIADYTNALHSGMQFPEEANVLLSVLLSAAELAAGTGMLLRASAKLSLLLCILFLSFFTPLTLWTAIADPVPDCGCFGDAVVLTNLETFLKNAVLLTMAVSLYIYNKPVVKNRHHLSRFVFPVSFACAIALSSYALYSLPPIDFRPFRVGADIRKGMQTPNGAEKPRYVTRFIMERNGVRKTFTLEDYPDSTWTLVETIIRQVSKGDEPLIKDFCLKTVQGRDDITDSILSAKKACLLFMPYTESASRKNAGKCNYLYEEAAALGIPFYAVTASTASGIMEWRRATGAVYPFLQMDATTIKTIIRSSPGLVLLEYGTVKGKWSHNTLPKSLFSSAANSNAVDTYSRR